MFTAFRWKIGANERAALMVNGPWQIPGLKKDKPKLKWDVSVLPKGQTSASILGGENIAITKSSKHVDARSDVFTMGILLYEMISGVNPFTNASYHSVVAAMPTQFKFVTLGQTRAVGACCARGSCCASDTRRRCGIRGA